MLPGEKVIWRLPGAASTGSGIVLEHEKNGWMQVAVLHYAGESLRPFRPVVLFPVMELIRGEIHGEHGKKPKSS